MEGHLSSGAHRSPLLREGAELPPGFTGSFPRKGHTHGMGGKLQLQSVSALPSKVKLVAVQERNAIYTQLSNTLRCALHIF